MVGFFFLIQSSCTWGWASLVFKEEQTQHSDFWLFKFHFVWFASGFRCASTPAANQLYFLKKQSRIGWVMYVWRCDKVNCEVQSHQVLCSLRSHIFFFLPVYGIFIFITFCELHLDLYICSSWPLIMHDTSLKCAWKKKKCACSMFLSLRYDHEHWTSPVVNNPMRLAWVVLEDLSDPST